MELSKSSEENFMRNGVDEAFSLVPTISAGTHIGIGGFSPAQMAISASVVEKCHSRILEP